MRSYLAGDKKAFDSIYKYVSQLIKQVIQYKCKRQHIYANHNDDLTQECWMVALKNLEKWDPSRGSFRNFLFTCFSNHMTSHMKCIAPLITAVPMERCENLFVSDPEAQIETQHFEMNLNIRFPDAKSQRVIELVSTQVMMCNYRNRKSKTFRTLREDTGLRAKQIKFLIDYTMVKLRRHCMEVGWQTNSGMIYEI